MEIARGAEAIIEQKDDVIRKTRVPKGYRLNELDLHLRRSRTRREAKVLDKLASHGIAAPRLFKSDKESVLEMEFLNGPKLRDVLGERDIHAVGKALGDIIAPMHAQGIIHGDLTTSNIIEREGYVLIDFGLSYFSDKDEDKAVDLHLLSQAVWSKHYRVAGEFLDVVFNTYAEHAGGERVLKRLEKVKARGRNKGK